MDYVIIIIIVLVMCATSFVIGRMSKMPKIVELSDIFRPSASRTGKNMMKDAVLQLQNEIAESGAVKKEELENGEVVVSIKVVV